MGLMRAPRIWAVGLLAVVAVGALGLGVFRGPAAAVRSTREPPVLAGARPARARCRLNQAEPEVSPDALVDVRFVSGSTGWALGSARILMTSDGGRHWTVEAVSRTASWSSMDVISASHGWVVGDNGLQVTTDGGRHWLALPQTCPAIRALDFINPRDGFAIASGQAGPQGAVSGTRGAVLLATDDAGRSWRRLPTPKRPQSVCFHNSQSGWLGAGGNIYATTDGGRHWTLSFTGPTPIRPGYTATIALQCTASGGDWAQDVGPGGEASQEPHIGLHSYGSTWTAIFAEQYFPHPGIRVERQSPGSDPGAFSAINASSAVFLDVCPACEPGASAPFAIARAGGARLTRTGNVTGITGPLAASFTSTSQGWVIGVLEHYHPTGVNAFTYLIVHTGDGGRSWHSQYRMPTTRG